MKKKTELKELREKRGLTQQELCKILGIKRSRYSNYELGLNSIPLNLVPKLQKVLRYNKIDIFLDQ